MIINDIHSKNVFLRRKRILTQNIAHLITEGSTILDVGTGDGSIAHNIKKQKLAAEVAGIDVLIRPKTAIPVKQFDGQKIPYNDDSYDIVLFVDVLHHTNDPQVLLNEAARVAKKYVIIKDHHKNGLFARQTLRFMDWVGNARFGVALPYNYWSQEEWENGYRKAGLIITERRTSLKLYPVWADWLFGRSLHSIVLLEKTNTNR